MNNTLVEGMGVGEAGRRDTVSVAIVRVVKPERTTEFESWLQEIGTAVSGFDGYTGMDIVRPTDPSTGTYVIILHFSSHDLYTAWHRSTERAKIVERSAELTVGDPVLEEARGLEGWFTPPAPPAQKAPPARYKMAILTIVGLYPLIVGIGAIVTAVTGLPAALATLITVILVALVATYWVMPWITHVSHHWLFPQR